MHAGQHQTRSASCQGANLAGLHIAIPKLSHQALPGYASRLGTRTSHVTVYLPQPIGIIGHVQHPYPGGNKTSLC